LARPSVLQTYIRNSRPSQRQPSKSPSVLESFRKEARRRRVGYQTLINEVLAEHARKDVA